MAGVITVAFLGRYSLTKLSDVIYRPHANSCVKAEEDNSRENNFNDLIQLYVFGQ